MSTLTLQIPANYTWVLLSAVATVPITWWQFSLVGAARKKAGIKYPQMYAEAAQAQASIDAMKFNCVQRAHQNTLESYPQVLLCLLITGLQFPIVASSLGATWVIGRLFYTSGYATGVPNKRYNGAGGLAHGATALLTLTAIWTAVSLVLGDKNIFDIPRSLLKQGL